MNSQPSEDFFKTLEIGHTYILILQLSLFCENSKKSFISEQLLCIKYIFSNFECHSTRYEGIVLKEYFAYLGTLLITFRLSSNIVHL